MATQRLCLDCKTELYVDVIGECNECGAATESASFQLCASCAGKRSRCQMCGEHVWRKKFPEG